MESHKMKWVRCWVKRVGFTVGMLYPINENDLDVDGYPTTTDDDGSRRWIYNGNGTLCIRFEEVKEDEKN